MLKSRRKKPSQRTSRSVRLKKYEVLYEECLRRASERESHTKKSPVKKPKKSRKRVIPVKKSRVKTLNEYQKFVREESKNPVYKHMSATDRMKTIGNIWKNKQDLNSSGNTKRK